MTDGYPALSLGNCKLVAQAIEQHIAAGNKFESFDDSGLHEQVVRLKKPQIVFPMETLEKIILEFQSERKAIQISKGNAAWKRNAQEEEFAAHAVRLVRELPSEAVQDLDFWRYLSVFHLRDYIESIEGDFNPNRYGGEGNRQIIRWTLIRGLVWGLHTAKDDDFSYIYKVREAKEELGKGSEVRDLYISHVVRPAWTKTPNSGRALIDAALNEPALFDVGKNFRPWQTLQARIGRLSANVYLPSLSEEEMLGVFLLLREGIPHEPANLVK